MIKITDNSNPRLVTLLNATCGGRAQAVRYQGNVTFWGFTDAQPISQQKAKQ